MKQTGPIARKFKTTQRNEKKEPQRASYSSDVDKVVVRDIGANLQKQRRPLWQGAVAFLHESRGGQVGE